MMNDAVFKDYCTGLGLSPAGIELLGSVRKGLPVRRLESHVGNLIVRFPSKKMGFAVECESGRAEYPSVLELEHDPDVIEYYPQPCKLTLHYKSPTDRPLEVEHTPDFLVVRVGAVEFRECKTVDGATKLCQKQPNRYQMQGDRWVCPPGESAAKAYGFGYKVWTPIELTQAFSENLKYLDPYFKLSSEAYTPAQYVSVIDYVQANQGVMLAILVEKAGLDGAALIRWMIAHGHIFCDLHVVFVKEPDKVRVYTSRYLVQAAKHFEQDDSKWPTSLAGTPPPAGQVVSPLATAYMNFGEPAFEVANRRLACIEGRVSLPGISPRTQRNWKKAFRKAERLYGSGYIGLLPRCADQGNRKPRFDKAVYDLVDKVINEYYLVTAGMEAYAAYCVVKNRCATSGIAKAPSAVFFYERLKQLDPAKVKLAREGPRAAYSMLGGQHGTVGVLDAHGDYPLQCVHIDHTQLDVVVCSTDGQRILDRPWLTLAFDATSRSVLAFYITFSAPSVDSVMMIMREIVRRNGMLPLGITVDNGTEFRSTWFETFTAFHQIIVTRRPPRNPRFGSLIENCFGTATSQLIHSMSGNTKLMKNVRQVTKSVDPVNFAVWNMPDLCSIFEEYAFEVFNTRVNASLGMSPMEAFAAGIKKHGIGAIRKKEFNDDFLIETMVLVSDGTCRVQPARGVKVFGDYFWNPLLAFHLGKDVPVKYDPMDPGRVFAYIDEKWISCKSKYADLVAGMTVREVKALVSKLEVQHLTALRANAPKVAQVGAFLEDVKNKEGELRLQYERSKANREALADLPGLMMKGTPLDPVIGAEKTPAPPTVTPYVETDADSFETIQMPKFK